MTVKPRAKKADQFDQKQVELAHKRLREFSEFYRLTLGEMASLMGYSENYFTMLLARNRMITPQAAYLIEGATSGRFKAKELRPDMDNSVDPQTVAKFSSRINEIRDAKLALEKALQGV